MSVSSLGEAAWSYPTVYATSGPVAGVPIPVRAFSITYAAPSVPVRNATRPQSAFVRQHRLPDEPTDQRAHQQQERLQATQQAEWENTQRAFRPVLDVQTARVRRLRPASAMLPTTTSSATTGTSSSSAGDNGRTYHPLAYAVLRRGLVRDAEARLAVESPTVCVSSRPRFTFSSAPAAYPYRFLAKADYLPPEMTHSNASRRDPLPIVPPKYAAMKAAWRATRTS